MLDNDRICSKCLQYYVPDSVTQNYSSFIVFPLSQWWLCPLHWVFSGEQTLSWKLLCGKFNQIVLSKSVSVGRGKEVGGAQGEAGLRHSLKGPLQNSEIEHWVILRRTRWFRLCRPKPMSASSWMHTAGKGAWPWARAFCSAEVNFWRDLGIAGSLLTAPQPQQGRSANEARGCLPSIRSSHMPSFQFRLRAWGYLSFLSFHSLPVPPLKYDLHCCRAPPPRHLQFGWSK